MSPHVGNFVQDLVEMAKAVETVPVLERALSEATRSLESALAHNQGLESNIVGYKDQIAALNDKVRSLEVERDDASFRVLEAEDSASVVLSKAQVARATLDVIIAKLDPPKPQPEPEVLQPQAVELSRGQPIAGNGNGDPGQSEPSSLPQDWEQDKAEISRLPQGSSEPNPTVSETAIQSGYVQEVGSEINGSNATKQDIVQDPSAMEAPNSDVNPTNSPSGSSQDTHGEGKGPYFGKRYNDQPAYIGYWDWIAGGGTEADYYWRPEYKSGS